jgi:hypothetical protein
LLRAGYVAPGIRHRARLRKSGTQGLKPGTFEGLYGTAEAVP